VSAIEEKAFRRQIERLEVLIQDIERLPDPNARAHAQELVQALLDFHGAALNRLLDQVAETGEPGLALIDAFGRDDLVSSLLLLYGLHPLDLEARVQNALERVRPYLRSHGGNVELLGVSEGVVRLRMQGSCHGCPSSAMTLKLAIEEALDAAAPDMAALEVEGIVDAPDRRIPQLVPLGMLPEGNGKAHPERNGREDVDDLDTLPA
jgi:Fe-S cluster biogenesis protein NfuA